MHASITARHGGPLKKVWRSYEQQLRRRPMAMQMATTACMWAAGDVLAQQFAERRSSVDFRRVALTAAFGGTVVGPLGHLWYSSLDQLCSRFGAPGSAGFLLGKLLVDNLVYNSLNITAFFAFGSGVLDQESPAAFLSKMRSEFLPTFAAESSVWPPYMALVFTRVPLHHQLLAVNLGTIFDVCFLSWVRNQEGGLLGATAAAAMPQQLLSAPNKGAVGNGGRLRRRAAKGNGALGATFGRSGLASRGAGGGAQAGGSRAKRPIGRAAAALFPDTASESVLEVNSYVGLDASCTAIEASQE